MHGKPYNRAEVIEEGVSKIRGLNLFSDLFMITALRDKGASEYVLRKVLGNEDLEFTKVTTQWYLPNLTSKDSILDVFAEDVEGSLYNLEDQRSSTVDHARRTRYYGAMIDKNSLDKGKEYSELTDVYIVYISEKDVWHTGMTMSHVRKTLQGRDGTELPYDDGTHLIYVNGEVDDGSELAGMMKYFKTADPEDMSQGALSERVRYLKSKKGEPEMCEVSEWIYNQGKLAGEAEGEAKGEIKGEAKGEAKGEIKGEFKGRAKEIIDIYREIGLPDEGILEKLQAKLNVSLDKAMELLFGRQPA
ncbi:MAG: PD-(D/E)XK nuclease family transposase [Lachnospiraceae bacterium]|nr:PD-(D/E)XK nuclease family transposase [Lachnospiraceae bacterium]